MPLIVRTTLQQIEPLGVVRVIDSHCHVISQRNFSYPWLAQVPRLAYDFLLQDYAPQARLRA